MQRSPFRQIYRISSDHVNPCSWHHKYLKATLGTCFRSKHDVSPNQAATTSIQSPTVYNGCNEQNCRLKMRNRENQFRYLSSIANDTNRSGFLDRDQVEYLPEGITRQPDFFEEGITFIKNLDPNYIQSKNEHETQIHAARDQLTSLSSLDSTEALSSFDNMCLTIISKGCANIHDGNDGEGPEVRAWHASAIGWAELLTHASEWNKQCGTGITAAPMLAVAAVAPVVAQGGIHYLSRIDGLLANSTFADKSGSLVDMARYAAAFRDVFVSSMSTDTSEIDEGSGSNATWVPILSPRERWHLHALNQLLQNNHKEAMGAYLRLLEYYPGDLLGLSLALDVAYTLGDAGLGLRAATNVATYWTERDAGRFGGNYAHPGHAVATSLLALGLSSSSSSRTSTAERLAETALARESDSAGGISVWALAHSLASEGRSQEMVSRLATSDGVRLYENAGYLGFNTRMSGYGAISILDTQRSGAHRSATRLYDGSFGYVLQYSGNNRQGAERGGEELCINEMRVPSSVKDDVKGAVGSMFSGWFGTKDVSSSIEREPDEKIQPSQRSAEAVLTWLPPSPIVLTQATALLLRLTLSGAISSSDERWADIRIAWDLTFQNSDNSQTKDDRASIEFNPLSLLAASLLFDPASLHSRSTCDQLQLAMKGLHQMGELMKFGQFKMQTAAPNNDNSDADKWREVLTSLAHVVDSTRWDMPSGMSSPTYLPPKNITDQKSNIGWDFDTRQFLEYALCHAAMKAGDYESLCVAKAVCSEAVTLRSNCPEMWNRYAIIMEQLGDDVAAENARAASISMGGGEGSSA